MTRHSIATAMVFAAEQLDNPPTGRRIWLRTPYVPEKATLLHVVGESNGCQSVLDKEAGCVTVFGFAGDIDSAEMLFTTLLLQATAEMTKKLSSGQKSDASYRRAFLLGFANHIGERLAEARQAATAEAETQYGTGMAVVLADQQAAVEDLVEATFGNLRKTRTRRVDMAGYTAGRTAAKNADLAGRRRLK